MARAVMPPELPDCPKCRSPQLHVFRADTRGLKWAECAGCNQVVLLDEKNEIAHVCTRE